MAEANKAVGKPKLGGPFSLVDQNGKPFTDADLLGRYSLVSHIDPRRLDTLSLSDTQQQ